MRSIIKVFVAFAFLMWFVSALMASFNFAGLSLSTTMAELTKRYPRSMVLDTFVYLSDEDSHDDISTIGLSRNGDVRTLTITFERQHPAGRPTYPLCEKLLSLLEERYRNPANVVDAQEERARNRRFEWKTSAESLRLSCFQMARQPLYAERLTIASAH
jgi:hypothetical protein